MTRSITPSELMALLTAAGPPMIVDVRREPVFAQAADMVAGAMWRDPFKVEAWADELPRDAEVVVYCVHGHEISQTARDKLAAKGMRARYLDGGIEAWRPAGGALLQIPLPTAKSAVGVEHGS